MQSKAKTVAQYLKQLPDDRRKAIEQIRKMILKNLPAGYEEGMQYGMIGYYVPLSIYPDGYHCGKNEPLPFASLASQKNHMALYCMGLYGSPEDSERFQKEWQATGKRLDMGKSCIRFKRIEDIPLDVVGKAIKRMTVKKFIKTYEEAILSNTARKAKKKVTTKVSKKKSAPKATVVKKAKKKVKKTAVKTQAKKKVTKKKSKK